MPNWHWEHIPNVTLPSIFICLTGADLGAVLADDIIAPLVDASGGCPSGHYKCKKVLNSAPDSNQSLQMAQAGPPRASCHSPLQTIMSKSNPRPGCDPDRALTMSPT